MDMMNGINRLNPEYLAFYPNNAHDFYVEVKNIDLKEVIRAIYGNTMIVGSSKKQDSDKETYYKSKSAKYDIIYNKPSKIDTRVFHMNIIQFDPDAVNMLSAGEDIRLFTAPSGFQFFMWVWFNSGMGHLTHPMFLFFGGDIMVKIILSIIILITNIINIVFLYTINKYLHDIEDLYIDINMEKIVREEIMEMKRSN